MFDVCCITTPASLQPARPHYTTAESRSRNQSQLQQLPAAASSFLTQRLNMTGQCFKRLISEEGPYYGLFLVENPSFMTIVLASLFPVYLLWSQHLFSIVS